MKKIISALLVLSMLFSLSACGKGASSSDSSEAASAQSSEESTISYEGEFWKNMDFPKEVHLTLAMVGPDNVIPSQSTSRATKLIEERSGGKIVIEIVYNGALGNEQSTLAQCMEGSIDITGAGIGTYSQYTSCLDVMQLPFLINSYEQEWAVMQSDEYKALIERADKELESVTIISSFDYGMRHFATINKPIQTMDDLKGMKIRSMGQPVIDEALKILGASPTNITYTDLYNALQNKIVDGEEVNITSVSQQKHYEVINYISEIGFYPFISLLCISNKTVQTFPEGYLELIKACFAESDKEYMEKDVYEWDSSSRQDCIDNGVEFNTITDKDAWIDKMSSIYEKKAAEDPMYAAFIEKAQSLQEN